MDPPLMHAGDGAQASRARLVGVGLIATAILIPVTMPVAVLRGLVAERFDVSETLTSLFMSINMIGALVSAPIMGAVSDRIRRRSRLIVAALIADAVCFWLLANATSFGGFMAIRFVEGAAHITALSALMAALADAGGSRGGLMGMAAAGITFGVALGAPLGGFLGRSDPLQPLYAGAALLVVVAAVAPMILPTPLERTARPGFQEILQLASSNRALLAPYAFAFVDRFTTGFFTTTFSLYMRRVFGMSPPQVGVLIAYFMLPFSMLSYPVGRWSERASRTALICGGTIVYGMLTASLGWWPPALLPLLMVSLGVAAAVMFIPTLLLTVDLTSPQLKGTALGGFNAAGSLGLMLGPIVGGVVSETVAAGAGWQAGYTTAFVVAGVSELLCVALTAPLLFRLKREGRTT
jgi:MFS family permease